MTVCKLTLLNNIVCLFGGFWLIFVVNVSYGSGIGSCPKYSTMKSFNVTRFMGRWYEVERSFYLMELASGCTTVDISKNDKGQIEVVTNAINRWTGAQSTPSKGIAKPTRNEPTIVKYKVETRLPAQLARLMPGSGTYQILATDYDNYAILWTCSSLRIAHSDLVWVLGRTREIDALRRVELYGALAALKIDSDRLLISKNQNCPDYK